MDEEFKKRVADYFTGPELVDFLDPPVPILVDLLEEFILENEEELKDYMNYGN